jgi:hypothetical protein
MMRFAFIAFVTLSIAGCAKDRTEIVIGIATNLAAPNPLAKVEITIVSDPDGSNSAVSADTVLPISGTVGQPYSLPGTFSVYSASGNADQFRALLVAEDAFGTALVTRSALLTLIPDETLFVRLGLVTLCEGMPRCNSTGMTCIEGNCATDEILSQQLPSYVPGMENQVECAGGATFYDTNTGLPLPQTAVNCPGATQCKEGVCR